MYRSLQRYLSLLHKYLQPQWRKTVIMTLLLLVTIGFDLYSPLIIKQFIDGIVAEAGTTFLLSQAVLFVCIAIIRQVIGVITGVLNTSIAWSSTNQLRRDLMEHCLTLDMRYHKEHTPGEMIERIDGDVSQLSNFFSNFLVELFRHALLLLGILILVYQFSWLVGLAMTFFVLVVFVVLSLVRRRTVDVWKKQREMSALFFGFLEERLRGTEDLRANGATGYTMQRFTQLRRRWFPIVLSTGWASIALFGGAQVLFAVGTVMTLALGAYLWSIGTITLGTIYVLFSYTNRLHYPLQQIQSQIQDFQQAQASIKRVEDLLNTRSVLEDGPGVQIPDSALSVEFEHVTFGYVPEEPVLHDVHFSLAPGQVLGLLGRTGSGKTTLARLLFRLYDVQQGEVCIGGVPVQQAKVQDLRRHIGLVTQDVQIFNASVRDNLTFFERTISDERIIAVLEDIGLAAWFHALPEGLETVLGKDGAGLSAGEAQLLAFTRVFLYDPGLVILDEASSRLDPATERLIEQAVDRLLAGRTAIIIAHRLGTIQRADEIAILEDGRLLEHGPRVVLAADSTSRFAYLLKTGLEEVLA